MKRHFRGRKNKRQRVTYVSKKRYAGMHRTFSMMRQTRPPSLPRQTRPSGVRTSLRLPRLPVAFRLRRHKESVIPAVQKVPRISTDQKVLLGIWAVFLMGVVYSLWMSMQVIGCCGQR
jgi:hypothetical protein